MTVRCFLSSRVKKTKFMVLGHGRTRGGRGHSSNAAVLLMSLRFHLLFHEDFTLIENVLVLDRDGGLWLKVLTCFLRRFIG